MTHKDIYRFHTVPATHEAWTLEEVANEIPAFDEWEFQREMDESNAGWK
jgi:hypothetical protein